MSTLQITSCQPSLYARRTSQFQHLSSKPCILPVHATIPLRNFSLTTRYASNQQQGIPILKNQKCRAASMYQDYQHPSPVCLLGGKGKNGSDDEGSPWKALENATGSLKEELSIENLLRKHIEKKEFYKDKTSVKRGGGGNHGGGSGRGGNGGGGAGGGGYEILQVILATLGFVFLYVCIISGDEWALLAKDYLKFLFKGSESHRLKRTMYKWRRFFQKLTKKKLNDSFRLEEGHNQYPDLVG